MDKTVEFHGWINDIVVIDDDFVPMMQVVNLWKYYVEIVLIMLEQLLNDFVLVLLHELYPPRKFLKRIFFP